MADKFPGRVRTHFTSKLHMFGPSPTDIRVEVENWGKSKWKVDH